MNSAHSRLASYVLGLCALLAPAAGRVRAQDDLPVKALFEADVVSLSATHNPTLQAALLEAESARWDARGLEAQYVPVVAVDASATQSSNPNMTRQYQIANNNGQPAIGLDFSKLPTKLAVSNMRQRHVDLGAEIRKHTLWGTDLTLRVAGNVMENDNLVSIGTMPKGPYGPGIGGLVKVSLKQPLLRGSGRAVNEASLLAARVQRSTSEYTRDRVASEVLRDALTAYWELWYAGASVQIEEQARAVAQQQRDEAQARVETGSLAPADVLTFDTQLATRDESLLNARLARRQREIELLQQLGLVEEGTPLSVRAESEPVPILPPRDVAERDALADSAELKELGSAVELATLQQKTAADPQRARLDLDSYVQTQGIGVNKQFGDAAQMAFGTTNGISAYVGLTYEAPVNRQRERAEAAKARIATEVAQQNLRQGRQRILAQVASLHEKGRSGEQAVSLAERTLEIARQQLAAERARYATGSSTSLQVVESEDKVRSAELRVARLRADLMESVLQIAHYTGDLVAKFAGVQAQQP